MDGKPLHCFYPHHDHRCHHPSTEYSFPFTPLRSTSPSPTGCGCCCCFFFLGGSRWGERCIDRTGCTSEEAWEGYINPSSFCFSPRVHFHSLYPGLRVCWCLYQYPALPGLWFSPYDCKLRVNFHCWLRLGLQTSTVSPPILALRLSRQRLLPTWRSFELDSICSHFWWNTTISWHKHNIQSVEFRVQLRSTDVPVRPNFTCLLSFSRQPCSLMREPAVLSTTVRHKSMCLTDLSLVRAHSFYKNGNMEKRLVKMHPQLCVPTYPG